MIVRREKKTERRYLTWRRRRGTRIKRGRKGGKIGEVKSEKGTQ